MERIFRGIAEPTTTRPGSIAISEAELMLDVNTEKHARKK